MTTDPTPQTTVRVESHGAWGELVLSRPARRNALIGPMAVELRLGLTELVRSGAKAIVLRGEDDAFCSGLDVDAFAADPPPPWRETWPQDWLALHRDLYACPAVIVGALQRFAINGGASLALACDLLVAGEGAFLMVGEAALGMHAPMNIAWLRLRVGEAVATQLVLGADRATAADLHRFGLAYKVVADTSVTTDAEALAQRLGSFPGRGLAAIKDSLRRPLGDSDVFAAMMQGDPPNVGPTRAPRAS